MTGTHEIEMFIGAAVLVSTLVIVARMKQQPIRIERARPGADTSDMTREGADLILDGICPVCRQEGFYNGHVTRDTFELFCGNPDCRTALEITNLGPGNIWWKISGKAPDQLYSAKSTRAMNDNSWFSRVWTRRREA